VILERGLSEGDLGGNLVFALCQNVAPLYPRRLANFLSFFGGLRPA
jgi:hypothetical protein